MTKEDIKEKLEDLENKKSKAIHNQDYIYAAHLRDESRRIEALIPMNKNKAGNNR